LCKTKGGEEYSYLKNCYDILLKVNNSTLTPSEEKMLTSCKNYKLKGLDGKDIDLITENELEHLLIKKGTFTENERKEMESHVYHTYAYLNKIPWTKKLKDVPKIACMHHEKLDGTGYPFGLKDGDIHTYGKIMAIADIFDALTAKDRPYKKAVSVEKVLEILKLEAENNKLDRKIVDFFVQKRVFEKI
jgi:response regulator RpfG family c-di-GMP phosphodiesterase